MGYGSEIRMKGHWEFEYMGIRYKCQVNKKKTDKPNEDIEGFPHYWVTEKNCKCKGEIRMNLVYRIIGLQRKIVNVKVKSE